jgi:hypothetical protein
MASEAQAAADTPLSVEAAVGLLDATPKPAEPEEQDAPEPTAEFTAEPTAEDDPAPEEASGEDEDDAAPEDPETPAIPAPKSWDAEQRAVFARLDREAQEIILAREGERDKAVNRAQTEAAEVRKKAQDEIQTVIRVRAVLNQILPQAAQSFQSKWDQMTPDRWVAWAREDPSAYTAGRAQYDAEQAQLTQLRTVSQQAERVARQAFIRDESERLKTLAPALADPKDGPARKTALVTYLVDQGVDRSLISDLDARTISIAHKAMLWDQAQKSLARKPAPAPARPALKPAAATQVRTPQREAAAVKNRFAQTGSIDDAVAWLNARG